MSEAPARAFVPSLFHMMGLAGQAPPPRGMRVALPERGELFVRALRGPRRAPTVVLLHGWVASGGLNWFQAFEPLSRHFRVLAPDLRGHGRGPRSLQPFRLRDCADDVAALLETLRTGPAIVVGYSMGGAVAKLLWKFHRERVAGLVLAATCGRPVRSELAGRWMEGLMETAVVGGRLADWSTWLPRAFARGVLERTPPSRAGDLSQWARSEMSRHDWRHLLEAGAELGRFDATRWLRGIDVPTSVVVTQRDAAIPAQLQHAMAQLIPNATVHTLDAGHLACMRPEFGTTIAHACEDVAGRLD